MKKANYTITIKLIIVLLMLMIFLNGCRVEEKTYELTNYIGDSVKTFEKQTKAELSETGNGIYTIDEIIQIIAPKGNITSVSLIDKADKYTISGVSIGMNKEEADSLLNEIYGNELTKTINSDNNSITYSYARKLNELYVSYDIDNENVVEISYYDLSGKKGDSNDDNNGELIAMIGDIRVYYNEAMVYVKSVKENYESVYGEDIWDVDIYGNGKKFKDIIKDEVIKQITELKVIGDKAKEYEIELDEDGLTQAINYAADHYEGISDEDIDKYLVNRELLEKVYSDNLLAQKMFETLTINVDTNVPDIDAKQVTIQHILIYSTKLDDNGNRVAMSLPEKEEAYVKVNLLMEEAKTTQDFLALAQENSQADDIEFTFGRGNGPEQYSDSFELGAFALKTGGISDIISTDYGWHILYCVTDYNESATTQVKENIIEQRRNNMFASLYEEWSSDYDVIVNSEVWDSINFKD